MNSFAIRLESVGKLYKLYQCSFDKIADAFGLGRFLFWRKKFVKEFWALRDLNLTINKGERLGIIGRNGAGKSTLLKMISGNIAPTEGTLGVAGKVQALLELGTGFHPEFTGRQNIRASLAYHGLPTRQVQEMEEEIIDFAELEDFIDQPIKTYSSGMYARLAFSTATIIEPEILIIDEILGAGDAYFTGKCIERMKRLTIESGATVLFVSHALPSVQQLCSRAIWLERGRILADGAPLEVIKAYTAVVRKEEETRLKARDLKVRKDQAALMDNSNEDFERLLFHFVPESGRTPEKISKIYRIALRNESDEICAIDVGSPMDNHPQQINCILDGSGLLDWGPAKSDKRGAYREYGNFKGKYGHAPFELALPRSYSSMEPLTLEIKAEINENIVVELFRNNHYQQLAVLTHGFNLYTIPFNLKAFVPAVLTHDISPTELETIPKSEPVPVLVSKESAHSSEYGSHEVIIRRVSIYDGYGREAKILEAGQPAQVVFEYEAQLVVENPVFVFCVYLPDGRCATQWIVTSEETGFTEIYGQGRIVFDIEQLLLGRGAYVASAAIFKELRIDGVEPNAYHVLDRCIHFEISQAPGDNCEKGLCLQPFRVALYNGL